MGGQEVLRVLLLAAQLVKLGVDVVGEHGPRQEEGDVGVDVVVLQQRRQRRQAAYVVVDAEVQRQEGAELDQRVLALVIELADQLQVRQLRVRLAVHDAVALLRDQQAQRDGQLVLDQHLLQPLRRLFRVAHLSSRNRVVA